MFDFGREVVEATFHEPDVVGDFQKNMWMIHHNASAILENFTREIRSVAKIACGKSCSFCCHIRVGVSPLEIFILARFIRETFTDDEFRRVKQTLKENVGRLVGKSSEEQASMKMPCALLNQEGNCSCYSSRPISCRRWLSSDVKSCKTAFERPSGLGQIPLEGGIYAAGVGIEDELIRQLDKRGLHSSDYELQAGLLCVLENEDAEEQWCRGENVFQNCIRK
jgi:Fe-S-cluster containining protein